MTAIVGLFCKDGIVIASESQESDDDAGMKRLDVTKVYDTDYFGFTDVDIIVAGTGSSAYIARAAELIEQKGYAPFFTNPRSVADVVEECLGQMKKRYGEEGGEEIDLELMVGVYCHNCPKDPQADDRRPPPEIGLFRILPPGENETMGVAEPVGDYSAIGSGGLFARYLLNRLHDEDHPPRNLTIDAGIREAVYVIEEVKKVDLWCGGPIQLICIRKTDERYILEKKKPKELSKIAADISESDQKIKEEQRSLFLPSGPSSPRRNRRPLS